VIVNKAHNKTPYELFNSRTPAIGFIKPFGCHVMILNTLDNLGKFEAKGDEGYFLGYSMSSKAFRVFNKRTKRVEENLHIEFLENKAIEKGSGPNWLFDIDSLTKSMNYMPVVDSGTNSTNFSEHLKSPLSQPQDACNTDAPESSGNSNPTATSINPPADQLETLTVETPIPTPSSETRLISKRVTNQAETLSLDNILTLSNQFEDILGVTTNSEESSGVEADVINMETTITASPTPTLRIHRDYPKRVRPIGTKWVLKNKKDEREIVIRNKARLVAQGHTQEEGIDYDEVFAPIARIEAIRLFLAYASFMGFTVYQMDVKSAFLYGTIDEEVYVMQSPGFQDPKYLARVYKMEKAMGTIDQTLFIRRQRGDFILVQVYVDDIIFGSLNPHLCREFEALMHEKFQMSAMEKSKHNIDFHPMVDFVKASPLRSRDDAPIKGRRIDEEEVATERVSDDTEEVRLDEGEVAAERASEDTEEIATILTTMDAATILESGTAEVSTGSGSIPTAGPSANEVPTGSDVVPTASPVFATATVVTPYRRRKGKEVMVESETPKKQKLQEQIDAQIARELKEQLEREDPRRSEQIARDKEIARIHAKEELQIMIDGLDRSIEVISKHLAKYDQAAADLTIRERIELINELVKYQDHHSKILQYQAQQQNRTKKQKRDFYMAVIRNNLGWKAKDFKGMTFKEVEAKFKTVWEQIKGGVSKIFEGEAAWLKRKGIRS
nr:retrovirus-related Pol polyprotein from transposon TNT 1-94 [Tanacetum cinerariifolium]